jgi:serine/threonine-protein phosphatase 5
LYSEAILLNPFEPAYYSNRAFAYLKTESYGYAIADADKAIALDKTYVKAYYRRATANMALSKFKESLKDLKNVTIFFLIIISFKSIIVNFFSLDT